MSLVMFPHLTFAQCAHLQALQTRLDDTNAMILAAIRNQDSQSIATGFAARCLIVDEQIQLVCGRRFGFRSRS